MIVVAYLDLIRSPTEVRYLVKRLRDRPPTARVIGLWAEGDATPTGELRKAIGVDVCAATLGAALDEIGGSSALADAA